MFVSLIFFFKEERLKVMEEINDKKVHKNYRDCVNMLSVLNKMDKDKRIFRKLENYRAAR